MSVRKSKRQGRRQLFRLALVLGLSIGFGGSTYAQSSRGTAGNPERTLRAADDRRQVILSAAREIMQAVRYCAVITVDESGRPQARTVDAFPPDERMAVWFATNPKSRKVGQIRKQPRVTLHYFDAHSPEQGYVTLLGRARLVNDSAEKRKRWKDGWEAFWPDRDASYLLVEVTPERLEIFSPKHGIGSDPVTWRPATVDFGKEKRGQP